jgi:hypothetical protein
MATPTATAAIPVRHFNLGAPTYANSPWLASDLAEKAAREYGLAHGYKGAQGGWIWRVDASGLAQGKHPVCQGWFNFWTIFRREIENHFTQKLTAFPTFDAMVNPESKTYRPTILVRDTPRDWRQAFLASAYDVYQGAAFRRDPRRAYTGYPVDAPAPARLSVHPGPGSPWLSFVVQGAVRG